MSETALTRREAHASFVELAGKFQELLMHRLSLTAKRDAAELRLGQLRGMVLTAEAELSSAQKALDDDRAMGETWGEFLLKQMEQHPFSTGDYAEERPRLIVGGGAASEATKGDHA